MLQRIGRYEILERIAAGGQGTVYRARDTVLDRVVAVKVINQPVTDDPQYLEALQREARLAARLDHPNITRVHDFQVEGDTAYIVMEYVPDSLDKHVRAGQPLPYQRAVEIAVQICRGLAHAHENGVVHRDIKPQNILLTEDGTAKVTDFGIARALVSSTQSRGTRTMGTPWYMALEQWSGSRVDGRADLYSLGILLYEMLTGSVPFQGEAIEAIYVQRREAPVPPISGHLDVPMAVEDVVRRALEKSPEGRFANASAMADALEGALTGVSGRGRDRSDWAMDVGGSNLEYLREELEAFEDRVARLKAGTKELESLDTSGFSEGAHVLSGILKSPDMVEEAEARLAALNEAMNFG